jgi:hypothetical protein
MNSTASPSPFPGTLSQNAEQRRRQRAADQRPESHLKADQQCERRSGQCQFAGPVHGERHLAHHDERPDQPGHQSEQRRRQQRLLDEVVAQQPRGDVKREQVVQHLGEPVVHPAHPS